MQNSTNLNNVTKLKDYIFKHNQEHGFNLDYDCKGTNHKAQVAEPVLPRVFQVLLAHGRPLPNKAPDHEVESNVARERERDTKNIYWNGSHGLMFALFSDIISYHISMMEHLMKTVVHAFVCSERFVPRPFFKETTCINVVHQKAINDFNQIGTSLVAKM